MCSCAYVHFNTRLCKHFEECRLIALKYITLMADLMKDWNLCPMNGNLKLAPHTLEIKHPPLWKNGYSCSLPHFDLDGSFSVWYACMAFSHPALITAPSFKMPANQIIWLLLYSRRGLNRKRTGGGERGNAGISHSPPPPAALGAAIFLINSVSHCDLPWPWWRMNILFALL